MPLKHTSSTELHPRTLQPWAHNSLIRVEVGLHLKPVKSIFKILLVFYFQVTQYTPQQPVDIYAESQVGCMPWKLKLVLFKVIQVDLWAHSYCRRIKRFFAKNITELWIKVICYEQCVCLLEFLTTGARQGINFFTLQI